MYMRIYIDTYHSSKCYKYWYLNAFLSVLLLYVSIHDSRAIHMHGNHSTIKQHLPTSLDIFKTKNIR